jgi:hypothetical protein
MSILDIKNFCKMTKNNFFKEIGSSPNPCSDLYAGSAANSEIEVKTISNYIFSIRSNLVSFMTFHAYAQLWMSPWGKFQYFFSQVNINAHQLFLRLYN